MKIALLPLADLQPHPDNPRKAGPGAVKDLVRLITENGWTQPLVVSQRRNGKYIILVGHHRRLAAAEIHRQKLAIPDHDDTALVPAKIHTGLSPKREYAIMTSDNVRKTAWDSTKLKKALQKARGVFAGFSVGDASRIVNAAAQTNFNDVSRRKRSRTMTCTLTTPKAAAALAEWLREKKLAFWQWTE